MTRWMGIMILILNAGCQLKTYLTFFFDSETFLTFLFFRISLEKVFFWIDFSVFNWAGLSA